MAMVKNHSRVLAAVCFALAAFTVFCCVLFIKPVTGVADQNDFRRLMYGMEYPDRAYFQDTLFTRYIETEFAFTPFPHKSFTWAEQGMSPIYLIYPARLLSKLLGYGTFQLWILAALTGVIYTFFFALLFYAIMPEHPAARFALAALLLFVFFDGRWVMWFFSLYGEPFVLTAPEPYTEPPRQDSIKRFTFDMRV